MRRSTLLAAVSAVVALLLASCGGGSSRALVASPAEPPAPPAALAEVPPPPAPLDAASAAAVPAPEPPPKLRKVVVLDPGHGGDEVGASRNGVTEKHSNLDFALRVERLLSAYDVDVVLTRRDDARAAPPVPGFTPTRTDLQARIDIANAARGDVFVSIHSNGSEDTSQRGVEAWFDSSRPYAEEGRALAGLLVSHVLRELREYGYQTPNRGLFDGKCFRERMGRCFSLFVIGGPRATTREEVLRRGGDPEAAGFDGADVIYSRYADMPASLVELLIITNPDDAAVLRNEAGREAIARGVARAILEFLGLSPRGL